MKRILLLSMVFTFVFALSAFAQRTVSGKVTDDTGEGLPGVNVVIKGTTTGVTTDLDGNYSISVADDNAVLVFSSVGMETQEISVGARSTIDVGMSIDAKELQEVIVTGYGTTTKEKSSVSSITVSSDNINNRPNSSVVQTLSGQVAGLNITTSSGQPGANSTVNLRGVSSINGDTEPLFIIDGIPVDQDNFRSLNPNEIENIAVLKDAGATAIYGNRGANGVIVITTKRGEFGSPLQVDYTYIKSFSTLQNHRYNLLSSSEQLALERQQGAGLGGASNIGAMDGVLDPTLTYDMDHPTMPHWLDRNRPEGPLTDAEIANAPTTDWADFFFRTGVTNSHNLSFTKGSENTSTFINLGYWDQEGILEDSDLQRVNLRGNIAGTSEDSKFSYGANVSLNYSESNEPNSIGSGAINRNYVLGAYQSVPYHSPEDYTNGADLLSPLLFSRTPLFLLDRLNTYTRREDEVRVITNVNFNYQIIDGLSVGVRSGVDYTAETLTRAEGPRSFNALLFAETGNTTPGFQDNIWTRRVTYNQLFQANYEKAFGDHSFNIGVYSEYFKAHLNTFSFRNEGLDPKTFYPGDGSGFVDDNANNDFFVDTADANIAQSGLFSYFSQLDYDFAGRFGASFTIRRDASSRFAQSNRWGTFYSVAGRWNLHQESFASGLPFDVLKLRASYGTNGNQDISGQGPFASLDLTRALFITGGGYGGANSLGLGQIPNNTLKWETVEQINVGIDAELFTSKLRANIDVYSKTTKELFLLTPISAINAANFLNANVGSLKNSGIDVTLNYDVLRDNDPQGLNVEVYVLGNYNKQEILDFPGETEEIPGIGRVGGKLREYYDYRYLGVNQSNGNMLFLTADGDVTENPNPDTDRVWLDKNIYPDVQGGFGLRASYMGFFVNAQFNYTIGVDRYDFDLSSFYNAGNIGQFRQSKDILDSWTPENPTASLPSLNADNVSFAGTRWLQEADYVRLRFLQVGYNVPQSVLDNVNFRSARVFVNGENIFTATSWRGFDAESINSTSRRYPTPKVWSVGVELGF